MDPLRLDAAAARVVAWHNRHPLARRIDATHVQSVGYVALPFERVPSQAPALGKVAPRAAALHGVFSEAFLAPLKASRVARWAARHGVELSQDPGDAPLHFVRPERAPVATAEPVTLYLLTAAVQVGEQLRRILLGPGDAPGVLGRRLWSGPRAAAALALLGVGLALAGLAVALALRPDAPGAPVPAVASAASAASGAAVARPSTAPPAAPAASVAGAASAAGTASASPTEIAAAPGEAAVTPEPEPASVQADLARPKTAPPRPNIRPGVDLSPHLGRIALPKLRPQLGEGVKAQARQVALATQAAKTAKTARAARASASAAAVAARRPASGAASPEAPGVAQAGSVAAAASTPAAEAPVAAKATFAVTTHALRTHAEAEQIMDAMVALLRGAGARQAQVEILPQGEDWRVVGWPFAHRDDAEKARAVLVARGMRVTVVDF